MQLQGELQTKGHQPHHYRGPLHGVSVIFRNEGALGLYRGIGCAYVYQILLNGCRLGFYEPMRQSLTSLLFRDSNVQSLGVNMASGAGSGIIGAAAGSPFFLVKTRLQSYSPFLPVGTQHNYGNAWNGLRTVWRAEGLQGMYRGVGAAMIRTGFGSSVQLPTYFFAKRRLMRHLDMQEGMGLHVASSAASGFVVCCVMHPPGEFFLVLFGFFFWFGPPVAEMVSRVFVQLTNVVLQIPLCRECTIRMETCTRASLIVWARRLGQKEFWQSTRDSCHTWQGFCRTQS